MVPIGVVALLAAVRVLPASKPDRRVRIEVTSAAIASGSMFLLIYPLIQGGELGWPTWTFAMVGCGVAGFAVLAAVERARDRAGKVTLVTPSLFTKRAFTSGLAAGMAFFGALMGLSIVFTLFVQVGLGFSPLKAGLAGSAQAIGMVVGFVVTLFLQEIPLRKSRGAAHTAPAVEGLEGGLLDEVVADLADVGEDLIPVDGVAAVEGAPHEDPAAPVTVGSTSARTR